MMDMPSEGWCVFVRLSPPRRGRVATFARASGGSFDCDYDMLVGADGVNSRVRGALEESVPDFTVRQTQVSKPPRSQLSKKAVHPVRRKRFRTSILDPR